MKKKCCYSLIKIFTCLNLSLFCCGILSAQTPQRKPSARRAKVSTNEKRKVENNRNIQAGSQTDIADAVADPKLQPDAEVAVFETDYGVIVVELYPKLAPLMVERFKRLIREGFYDKTTFHRASPALGIIQGGDPNSKDTNPKNDGYGKSPYPNVPAENSDIPYARGIVGAARSNDPNSANCQFFIMLKRQPLFDTKYTIFGRVIEGLSNAYVISISPNIGATERPEDPVVVRRVSLQARKKFIAGNRLF